MVRPSFLKFAGLSLAAAVVLAAAPFAGAQNTARPLIAGEIDSSKLVTLEGNVHPLATAGNDRGAVEDGFPETDLLLVLKRSPEQEKALATLNDGQYDRGSKYYHQWLTPEEYGQAFGLADSDMAKITDWLALNGFHVDYVTPGRTFIKMSGTARALREGFHTQIHQYSYKGKTYYANANDPQIPMALRSVLAGFASLNNFPRVKTVERVGVVERDNATGEGKLLGGEPEKPLYTPTGSSGVYPIVPGDFAKIYNLPAAATGAGQTIAIVEDSDMIVGDDTTFRAQFGLPTYGTAVSATVGSLQTFFGVNNGGTAYCADPGKNLDEGEVALDVEWAGAVAQKSTIDLVTCPSSGSTYGFQTAATAIVNNVGSQFSSVSVLSMSYGVSEISLGTSGNASWNTLWQQAATEGISVSVSTGDSLALGGAPYDELTSGSGASKKYADIAAYGLRVTGTSSTPYNVAAGGTDFGDGYAGTGTTYFGSNTTNYVSALSYVPETTWNNSCVSPLIYTALGGTSPFTICNTKADWGVTDADNGYTNFTGGSGGLSNCTIGNGTTTCSGGYAQPSWQSGVYGITSGATRSVPDISMFAGNGVWGHYELVCMSDTTEQGAACSISNASTTDLGYGGTSLVAPEFAGVMALIDASQGGKQGNPNYVLYRLASVEYGGPTNENTTGTTIGNATSCASSLGASVNSKCVFYDIYQTTGNSTRSTVTGTIAAPCYWPSAAGATTNCAGSTALSTSSIGILSATSSTTALSYNLTPGYDSATGIGSINIGNLISAWSAAGDYLPDTTALTATPSSYTYGASTVLKATVTSTNTNAILPTGVVTFYNGPTAGTGTNLGTCTITAGGTCSLTVATIPAGTSSVSASYAGGCTANDYPTVSNYCYASSISALVSVTVTKQTPSTTIQTPAINGVTQPYGSPAAFNATATLMWTGTGNAPTAANVVFVTNASGSWGATTCGTTSPATCTATFTPTVNPVGSYYVSVNFTGDGNYNASSSTQNAGAYVVVAAATTVSAVTITPSTIYVGQTGTVSATLTWAGTGTAPGSGNSILAFSASNNSVPAASATFSGETCTVGTNTLTCTATLTPAASDTTGTLYTVTALYATTTNYTTNSNTGTWTYGAPTQVMTKPTSSLNPSTYNSSVTFTTTRTYPAGANAPTGTVSILVYIGSTLTYTLPATCGAGNPQTCTATDAILPVNTYNVYGYAAADSTDGYATARSLNALSQVVNQQTPTVTETATSEPYGTAIPLTSTVTFVSDSDGAVAATGTVTFTVSSGGTAVGTASCTLASATATTSTCSTTYPAGLAGGAYTVVAAYGGDTDYGTASSGSSGFNVTPVTSSLTLAAATAGTTTAGTTSSLLTATLSPAVSGVTITFTDATNGTTLGTGMTNASGVATLTVTTATTGVSAGLNNMTATATATASVGTSTSTAVPVYLQGILQATSLNHNFTAYTVGETGVDGTTDGSPICNGSNGVNGQTCTTGYSVAVTNFTSSTQVITATLGTLADKAFTYATNCPAAGLAAYAKCQFVFYYLPPYGDGCTPNSNCTTGGTSPNTYQQGTFEETTWSVGTSGVLKGLYFSGTTGGGAPLSPVVLEGKAILATGNYLSVTPTSLSFGPQAPNSVSATQDITVTNGSSGALAGITYSVASGTATNSHFTTNNQCAATLAAGASCQIQVSYSDATVESSSLTLTITPPSPEVALTVSLSGSTVAKTNTLSLNTTTHNFGNVTLNSTVTFGLGLVNNSTTTASTASFSYSQANGFTFDTSSCPASLAAGASCQVNVSFTPTAAGTYSQILTVHDNLQILPNGTTSAPYSDTVTFNGNGVAGGNLTATNTGHDYGTVAVGSEATAFGVELSNNTGGTVTLSTGGGTFASNGAADGYTYATNCGTTMAANTNCEYVFYFTPQSVGQTQVFFPLSGGSSYPLNGSVTGITLTGTGQ